MPEILRMNTNLMGTTSFWARLDKSGVTNSIQNPELGQSLLSLPSNPDNSLPGAKRVFHQGRGHLVHPSLEAPRQESDVYLLHLSFSEMAMQFTKHTPLLRHHEQSGRIPVEPMDQLQKRRFRPEHTQSFDYPPSDTTATMNSKTGWFVEDQQAVLFIDDPGSQISRHPGTRLHRWPRLRQTQWRHTNNVPHLKPIIRPAPPLVHTHLSRPHDPVYQRPGGAFELRKQEIVEPLARHVVRNDDLPDRGRSPFIGSHGKTI
ncbi:MAG: hypothetical protein K0S46_572 [Moraxellaceae bacterium]|nr:hypothetical protein [Moraxellaceae bacterium]